MNRIACHLVSVRGEDHNDLVESLQQTHIPGNISRDSTARIVLPELGVRRHISALNPR